jgi:hypothetical protein
MIPPADRGDEQENYVFLSHETARTNGGEYRGLAVVRDQWLSEGFANAQACCSRRCAA